MNMLSKSHFNKWLYMIRDLIVDLFFRLSEMTKELNIESEYIIDSFLEKTCGNMKITISKLVQGEIYKGKKLPCNGFYGFYVHVMVPTAGIPVEYTFYPVANITRKR